MARTASARRQGTIKDLGEGRWLVRLSLGVDCGKRVRHTKIIRGNKGEAQRYLNDLIRRREQRVHLGLTRQRLGEWIDEWLKTWCNQMSARTRWDYETLFERHLTKELRSRRLVELSPGEIQRWVNELAERLAPRTVRMAHGALRACLNKAVRLGKLGQNVAAQADLPRVKHTERVILAPEEARRFREAIRGNRWEAFFVVLLHTGIRPGEALGLQWSDIDGNMLRVRRALCRIPGKAAMLSSTKTCRSRVIPLGEQVQEALAEHRRSQVAWRLKMGPAYNDQGLIFADELGGFADGQNITNRHFKPLLAQTGLPKLRLYDLRHTCATLLLAAGEHPKVVQERLGHASITLTLDVYSHVVPGMQARASERLDEILRGTWPASATAQVGRGPIDHR